MCPCDTLILRNTYIITFRNNYVRPCDTLILKIYAYNSKQKYFTLQIRLCDTALRTGDSTLSHSCLVKESNGGWCGSFGKRYCT
jgi:hypothetical protein